MSKSTYLSSLLGDLRQQIRSVRNWALVFARHDQRINTHEFYQACAAMDATCDALCAQLASEDPTGTSVTSKERLAMTESDILYETGAYWVLQVRTGYEVYRSGVTHSTRCAVIGYRGAVGLAKARAEADRRAAVDKDTI